MSCAFDGLKLLSNVRVQTANSTCTNCGAILPDHEFGGIYLGHTESDRLFVAEIKPHTPYICVGCQKEITIYQEICDNGYYIDINSFEVVKGEL
ncbi:MAG: hypothetical protein ACW98W_20360 [Candidatus Hodarchaeales archaeon]